MSKICFVFFSFLKGPVIKLWVKERNMIKSDKNAFQTKISFIEFFFHFSKSGKKTFYLIDTSPSSFSRKYFKSIEPRPFSITIYTDACSEKGWGGTCLDQTASESKNAKGCLLHINCMELLATLLCLKSFVKGAGHHIKLHTDNTTAFACINRRGSSKQCLNDITREYCEWCITIY